VLSGIDFLGAEAKIFRRADSEAIELLGSLEDDLFLNVLFDSVFTP
jgi:hypothetical protein